MATNTEVAMAQAIANVDAAGLLRERELLGLLKELANEVEEEINNNDGRGFSSWGCGNCEAATPTPHSLGCRVRNAIFKAGLR